MISKIKLFIEWWIDNINLTMLEQEAGRNPRLIGAYDQARIKYLEKKIKRLQEEVDKLKQ